MICVSTFAVYVRRDLRIDIRRVVRRDPRLDIRRFEAGQIVRASGI